MLNCDFAVIARSAADRRRAPQLRADGRRRRAHPPPSSGRTGPRQRAHLQRPIPRCHRGCRLGPRARITADDELLTVGVELAESIAQKSPLAVANAKAVLHSLWSTNRTVEDGLRVERERNDEYCLTSHDAREGLEAFAREAPAPLRGPVTTVDPAPNPALPGAAPQADEDSQFYWDGLRDGRLLVQRCTECRSHRFPPMPACPSCAAPGGEIVELEPRGTIYSWIVVHRAFTPAFRDDVPYVVAVIDLPEGCRLVTRLEHRAPIQAGSPVVGTYFDHGTWTELRFRVTS